MSIKTEKVHILKDREYRKLVRAALSSNLDRQELKVLRANFELRWKADMRATKMWQRATGRKLTWPDHADLCVWLLEQLAEKEKQRFALSKKLGHGHK